MTIRDDIVRVARSYVGTPYHHRGRRPGVGLDCAGELICVCRELGLREPDFDVPNYDKTPTGELLEWCDRYMTRISKADMQPGDAIGLITDVDPQHLGILAPYRHGGLAIVHASNVSPHNKVIDHRLMFSGRFRFIAAWKLPGVE